MGCCASADVAPTMATAATTTRAIILDVVTDSPSPPRHFLCQLYQRRRVGKGDCTAFRCGQGLSCAVPTVTDGSGCRDSLVGTAHAKLTGMVRPCSRP